MSSPDEPQQYAVVGWSIEDIPDTDPPMTDEEKEDWLAKNETRLRDRLAELGNPAIDDMLSFDGYETDLPDEEEDEEEEEP